MPSKHDHPKYGGRRAGTPDKPPSLLERINERFPNFHPIREMVKMYSDPKTPPELKKRLRRNIDAYTVPKLKPSSKGARGQSAVN